MKKILLTVAGSMLGIAMFAQTPKQDSIKAVVASWKAAFRATKNVELLTLNYLDSTIAPTLTASGTIINKTFEPQGGAATTLKTYWDVTEKALRLDHDWSANTGKAGSFANWGDYLFNYWITKQTKDATKFNPFYNSTAWKAKAVADRDSVIGVTLDLTDSAQRVIKVEYKLVGLDPKDSADMRMDLIDVNGRSTGGHSAKRIIGGTTLPNNGEYQTAIFYWNAQKDWASLETGGFQGSGDAALNDAAQQSFSDGYDATWFSCANGRGYGLSAATAEAGLYGFIPNGSLVPKPAKDGNSPFTGDKYDIDLDAKNIAGYKIIINDGPSVGYHDLKFSILIKSITIGNEASSNDITIDAPIVNKDVVANYTKVGSVYSYDGTATVVNALGQVVIPATTGSIDVQNLTSGIYFIIVNGVAAEIVK